MKKVTKILLILCLASAFTATTTFAQLFNFRFDENGNLSFSSPLGSGTAQGQIGVDPISNMQGLFYDASGLGVHWVPGDVLLTHPGTTEFVSDLVRFTVDPASGTAQSIFFFSLLNDEPGEPVTLADVPQLPPPFGNIVQIPEQNLGPLGYGAVYVPTPNQPGGVLDSLLYANNVGYTIISDVVPEPTAAALLGVAAGLMAVFRRRQ
jgi:hypothetical protein